MIKLVTIFALMSFSYSAFSAFEPADAQMVNLNIQIKGKSKIVKTDIAIPFYQTAELEKKVDNRDLTFEVNPKKGKNLNEVALEVRLFNKKGSKVIGKKEIVARMNRETVLTIKGVTFKVTPVI